MQSPVFIVGAGPGDPELITLKGARLLREAEVVVHAGSLVHPKILEHCSPGCQLHDSAVLTLEQICDLMIKNWKAGLKVVRLHSGDSSIYGATTEQTNVLDKAGVPWVIVPGVSSFQAAAAVLGAELTLPGVSQSVILTRVEGRSSPMPEREKLADLGAHQATLCLFLSASLGTKIQQELLPAYGASCPAAIVVRASWDDQLVFRCDLKDLAATLKENKITKTAMIIVGRALAKEGEASKLYDAHFSHGYRKAASSS
jgi:precorrin-4/cobalt-precorrin-4 C11-methyltransferase